AVIVTTIFPIHPDDPSLSGGVTLRLTGSMQFAWNPRGTNVAGSVAARIRHVAEPKYTSAAMRAQIEGPLELDVVVQPDGPLGEIKVAKPPETSEGPDTTSINAPKLWPFEPAKKNDRPVPAIVTIALLFRLH